MQDKKNIIVRTCGLYSDVLPVDLLQGEEGWEPFDHSLSIYIYVKGWIKVRFPLPRIEYTYNDLRRAIQ
jgi:hypothetical protein